MQNFYYIIVNNIITTVDYLNTMIYVSRANLLQYKINFFI